MGDYVKKSSVGDVLFQEGRTERRTLSRTVGFNVSKRVLGCERDEK